MASVEDVLKKLKATAKPDQVEGMAKFGIVAEKRMGVSVPDMRKIAKETGKNQSRPVGCLRRNQGTRK